MMGAIKTSYCNSHVGFLQCHVGIAIPIVVPPIRESFSKGRKINPPPVSQVSHLHPCEVQLRTNYRDNGEQLLLLKRSLF